MGSGAGASLLKFRGSPHRSALSRRWHVSACASTQSCKSPSRATWSPPVAPRCFLIMTREPEQGFARFLHDAALIRLLSPPATVPSLWPSMNRSRPPPELPDLCRAAFATALPDSAQKRPRGDRATRALSKAGTEQGEADARRSLHNLPDDRVHPLDLLDVGPGRGRGEEGRRRLVEEALFASLAATSCSQSRTLGGPESWLFAGTQRPSLLPARLPRPRLPAHAMTLWCDVRA